MGVVVQSQHHQTSRGWGSHHSSGRSPAIRNVRLVPSPDATVYRTIPRGDISWPGPRVLDGSKSHRHRRRFLEIFISVRQYRHRPPTALLPLRARCLTPSPPGPPLCGELRQSCRLPLALTARQQQESDDLTPPSEATRSHLHLVKYGAVSAPSLGLQFYYLLPPSWRPYQTHGEQHPSARLIPASRHCRI